jgi:isocitrate dehydrogenase (NAD+)
MNEAVLIRGDGIGPEIADAVVSILEKAGAQIKWHEAIAGEACIERGKDPMPEEVLADISAKGLALKGPLTTPVGKGYRSANVAMRQALNLYANLRPARNLPGVESVKENVDLIIVRENTEDLYAGIEHKIGDYAAESIKLITRPASERIAEFAYRYAIAHNRKKVSAVHKANIMKLSDGLFLESVQNIGVKYPQIESDDVIVDNLCMQLVIKPHAYDVLVLPNLYGDIVSDLCAGLVGGLGVAPSGNIGENTAVFEAVHGSAPKHAGKGTANPIALLLAAVMLLEHCEQQEVAGKVKQSLYQTLQEKDSLTPDLGGQGNTKTFAQAIMHRM